jgi:membrane fusion protein, multidrug efflux system
MKSNLFVALAICVLGGFMAGCSNKTEADRKALQTSSIDKNTRNKPTNVEVQRVELRQIRSSISTTGSLLANEAVNLQSEVAGRITKLLFREGSFVRKGDVLVQLFDEDQQATLEKLKVRERTTAELERRQAELRKIEAISQEVYEQTVLSLESARADIRIQEVTLAKMRIVAPFDGVVGLRQISEGSYLTPGTLIARIQNLNPLKVEGTLPEKYQNVLRAGDKITFQVEGEQGDFVGNVYAVDRQVDPTTRVFAFRATCPNPSGKLSPGSFARITVYLGAQRPVLLIPTQALIPDIAGFKVFLVKGGKAESVPVTIGERTDSEVEVTTGLHEGDSLVTTGLLQIRPGQITNVLGGKSK